ncbi:tyrosine-type recombinase/integrase [Acidithiobacillus sp. HP-6]|uniref:tyrosine-type recombinase/integrase n=1 Tax=unclassified Acidithiobacillus TaxID=2614800 RepID=UPI00187A51F9|nr:MULTISPECIES: tyrosine-type recombinase/integrase [unclassified Acidithiobacillus]MBE7564002.1 tyrosine-type recombinase/integrase [Acidithiobacillus sp. HP-6]MBE7569243.1 tyrosine-type recombinase/integrase [Acidithiobacillus sp. HP-2]
MMEEAKFSLNVATPKPPIQTASFKEIRQEILQMPAAKRGQFLFDEAEIEEYERWLLRESNTAYARKKGTEGLPYRTFLNNLQGAVTHFLVSDKGRESLATTLHDRILETYAPDGGNNKCTDIKAGLKSRLRAQAKCLQYFSLLIRRGNQASLWTWCPPAVPMMLEREAIPFRRQAMADYQQVGNARMLLKQAMQQKHSRLDGSRAEIQAYCEGEILLSALLFGGLGEMVALKCLSSMLRGRHALVYFESPGLTFWDLQIPMPRGGVRLRRWFPDPFSEILILHYLRAFPRTDDAEDTLQQRTSEISAQEIQRIMTLPLRKWPRIGRRHLQIRALFRGMTQAARLELPQFLGAYALGDLDAHALVSQSWWRIHGYSEGSQAKISEAKESISNKADAALESAPEVMEGVVTVAWLRALRQAMRAKNRANALKLLKDALKQENVSDPLGRRMFAWAEHLLKEGSSYRHRLEMTTIRRYVSRLAALMLQVLEDTQLVESFGDPSWRQLYEDLLEQVDTVHQRVHLIRAIREWHQFLVERQGVDPLLLQDLGGFQIDVIPDAQVISEAEFVRLKKRLQDGRHALHHQQLPNLLTLVAILGYRCGLRRMEVLRLRLTDCHLIGQARLLIRPFSERRLKTRHATRALPLDVLLENDELELLRKWIAYRGESGAVSGEEYLFVLPEIGHNPIAQETAMSRIHADMRAVTGNQSLHFHHLRHSFANQILWKLMLADIGPQYLPLPYKSEQGSARVFRQRLLGVDHANRKQLYAVAALLGHSGPEISMNHYLHNLDLILALHLRVQIAEAHSIRDWLAILAGLLHEKTIYRAYKQAGMDGLLSRLRIKMPDDLQSPEFLQEDGMFQTVSSETASAQSVGASKIRILENLWYLLLQGFTQSAVITDPQKAEDELFWQPIAEDVDYTAQQLARMARKAQDIFALKSRMGPRHKSLKIPQFGKGTLEIPLPPRPLTRNDQEHLKNMLPGFWTMMEQDPALLSSALDAYLKRAWRSEPGVLLLRSPDDTKEVVLAQAYKQLLLQLGISPRNIRYLSFDHEKQRSRWRQSWRVALHLNKRDEIQVKHAFEKWESTEASWLQIQPVFERAGWQPQGMSPAFSYLMVMGAMVLVGL